MVMVSPPLSFSDGLRLRAVDQRFSFFQQHLHPRAAGVRELRSKKLVETLPGGISGNRNGDGEDGVGHRGRW